MPGTGRFKRNIFVGNFGDGTINVYDKRGTSLGLAQDAIDVTDELNLVTLVRDRWAAGERLD